MHFKMSAIWFNLDQSKILSSGNRLIQCTLTHSLQLWKKKGNPKICIKEAATGHVTPLNEINQ